MKRGAVRVKGDKVRVTGNEVRVKEDCSQSSKHGVALAAALSAACYPHPGICAHAGHLNVLSSPSRACTLPVRLRATLHHTRDVPLVRTQH